MTNTLSESTLAALADALSDPERVSAAKREQHRRREATAAVERDTAISRIPKLQARQAEAASQLESAMQELRAAEASVEHRRSIVCALADQCRSSDAELSNLLREVSLVHGGASVQMALLRLDQCVSEQKNRIATLEAAQWDLQYASDGVTVVWRRLKPAEAAMVAPAKNILQQLLAARDTVHALESAQGVSPASIRRTVVEILDHLGIPNADLLDQPHAR